MDCLNKIEEKQAMDTITWDEFAKVELRVGQIISAEIFTEARKPAYVLQVDLGHKSG
jgi:tRNA-binding protein